VVVTVASLLARAHELSALVDGLTGLALPSATDVRDQLARLVRPGFVTETGWARLPHLLRYLRAAQVRVEALPSGLARDQRLMAEVAQVQREVATWLAAISETHRDQAAVREVTWMVEELRVSLFAQHLGTPYPVSAKRIYKAMDALEP